MNDRTTGSVVAVTVAVRTKESEDANHFERDRDRRTM